MPAFYMMHSMANRSYKRLHIETLEQKQLLTADISLNSVDDVFGAIVRQDIGYDINEDGAIDFQDATFLVEDVLGTRWGDNNVDGQVSFADFLNLSDNFGLDDVGFAGGDTDGDGIVAFSDFLSLSSNFGFSKNDRVAEISDGAFQIPTRTMFDALSHFEDVPGALGVREVKFVVELDSGRISFLNQNQYSLHYNFAREVLGYPGGVAQFNSEAYFSDRRRFVVGSVIAHDNFLQPDQPPGLFTVEFWPTDAIGHNYVSYTMGRLLDAAPFMADRIAYHPSSDIQQGLADQESQLYLADERRVVSTEELFGNQTFSALNPGVSYGRLRVIDGSDNAPLTARDVVIFENIPNDLPHVAGVVTVQPQTPLSHVNLRAKQNDSPNAYIRDALSSAEFTDLVGQNVRFEVANGTYSIRAATNAEVDEHLFTIRPTTEQQPLRDLSQAEIVPLASLRNSDQTAYGAKAANLGELSRVLADEMVPDGVAVPFALYDQFMTENGFYEIAEGMMASASFRSDPARRQQMLSLFRNRIENGIVSESIRDRLETAYDELKQQFGDEASFRVRSSTNNEDLIGFTGAGLYDSKTHRPDEGRLENSVREVWASLWTFRAFEEREFWRIDHMEAAMGLAIHPNFDDEISNGVAVTKNIFNPFWTGFYVNVQVGEDLVTNPGANAIPEEFLISSIGQFFEWETQYIRRSNLTFPEGEPVLSESHVEELRIAMEAIQSHFQLVYNEQFNPDFAMDIEFKIDASGQLVIKQARPWVD